jgi:hypothetical protein
LIAGIGKIKIIRSDRILIDAWENQIVFLATQCVVGARDQNPDTGIQVSMLLTTAAMPYAPIKARVIQQARWKFVLTPNMRLYCKTMEALVKHSEIL